MADISAALSAWSTTASSNLPAGTTTIGAGLDDNLRQLQATVRADLAHYNFSALASAATVDLGAALGNFLEISGTTTITSFGTVSAGIWKYVTFQGALTLTHNATSLILPGGADITTAAGDAAIFHSKGAGNWKCVGYLPADGKPTVNTVLDSEFRITDNADTTKVVAFEASGVTTATTRTLTVPDASTTLVGHDATQTLTNKTLTSPVINTAVTGTAVASQAQMETGTATDVLASPGRLKYFPGIPKAWIAFNGGDGIAVASHGCTSARNSTGDYTVTFTTAFSSAGYCPIVSHSNVSAGSQAWAVISQLAATFRFNTYVESPSNVSSLSDSAIVSCVFFGDV